MGLHDRRESAVNVVVSGRHVDITPAMKSHAESKVSKLPKYYDRIQEIEVVYDNTKSDFSVEIIVNAEHKKEFVVHHTDADAYAAVDGCIDKLERLLSEHKKKLRNRKHPEGGATIRHQ
jgi:putative sigma-54 modulation protein